MKQVVRLTEQDIQNMVMQVLNESTNEFSFGGLRDRIKRMFGRDDKNQQTTPKPTPEPKQISYEDAMNYANKYKGQDGMWLKHMYDATKDKELCELVRQAINTHSKKQASQWMTNYAYGPQQNVAEAVNRVINKYLY